MSAYLVRNKPNSLPSRQRCFRPTPNDACRDSLAVGKSARGSFFFVGVPEPDAEDPRSMRRTYPCKLMLTFFVSFQVSDEDLTGGGERTFPAGLGTGLVLLITATQLRRKMISVLSNPRPFFTIFSRAAGQTDSLKETLERRSLTFSRLIKIACSAERVAQF